MKKLEKSTKKKIKLGVGLTLLAAFLAAGLYFTLRKTDDYSYTVLEEGGAVLEKYKGGETKVVVPDNINGEPVVAIGKSCFTGQDKITDVTLPDSVQSIGIYAFDDCTSLQSINMPASLTEIAEGAFRGTALTRVELPEGVKNIYKQAFAGCDKLEEITIPERLELIDAEAFAGCASLKAVELPAEMVFVGEGAFMNCTSLETVTFPLLTQSPDNENDNRISVQPRTFKGCTSLKTVELSGVKHWIDVEAFMGCTSLESVNSDGGCWVATRAFSGCSSLKSFDFGEDEKCWVREYAFEGCVSLETVENSHWIYYISDGAFSGCAALREIDLTGIFDNNESLGEGIFEGCESLSVIAFDGSKADLYAKANGIPVRAPETEPEAVGGEEPGE